MKVKVITIHSEYRNGVAYEVSSHVSNAMPLSKAKSHVAKRYAQARANHLRPNGIALATDSALTLPRRSDLLSNQPVLAFSAFNTRNQRHVMTVYLQRQP